MIELCLTALFAITTIIQTGRLSTLRQKFADVEIDLIKMKEDRDAYAEHLGQRIGAATFHLQKKYNGLKNEIVLLANKLEQESNAKTN